MPDLEERFKGLDEVRAPDLQRPIQARASSLRRPDHQVTAAEEAWQRYERRPRMTTWLTPALAAASILALGIGVAVIFHYARTSAPAHPRPTPSLAPGVVAWVNRPAPSYSPPPQPGPTPYPTNAAWCLASQLSVSTGPSGAATGHQLQGFAFTNVSHATCLLSGRPRVTGINPTGRRVALPLNPGQTFFGPLLPGDIAPGEKGFLFFATGSACGSGAQQQTRTQYRGLWFDLPGGGRLQSALTLTAGSCGLTMDDLGLFAHDVPIPTPAPGTPGTLEAHIDLPQSVRAGQTLRYTITLHNSTSVPVSLSPCPSYTETLGYPNNQAVTFWLNCDQVTAIPPGGQVVYAMQLRVPSDAITDVSKFGWQLNGPDGPYAGGTLTVLPPS
jgi:hypothetical protein